MPRKSEVFPERYEISALSVFPALSLNDIVPASSSASAVMPVFLKATMTASFLLSASVAPDRSIVYLFPATSIIADGAVKFL